MNKLDRNSVGAPIVRVKRGDVVVEDRNEEDPVTGKVIGKRTGHAAGLRRYLARGEISSRQHDAGVMFALDVEDASRTQVGAVEPGHVGGGGDPVVSMHVLAHRRIDAQRKVDAAVRVLGCVYPLVATVVLSDGSAPAWSERKGYGRESGFGMLLLGLDALVAHYEIS